MDLTPNSCFTFSIVLLETPNALACAKIDDAGTSFPSLKAFCKNSTAVLCLSELEHPDKSSSAEISTSPSH